MKKAFLALALFAAANFAFAQELSKEEKAALKAKEKAQKEEIKRINKVVNEAETLLATDAKSAEKKLKEALENEHTKNLASTWDLAGRIQLKINEAESNKSYLQQPYDTVLFHNSLYNMYQDFLTCDQYDCQPDAKGKVPLKYRSANAETMFQLRQNLLVAGIFFFNKQQNMQAYDFFDTYLSLGQQPMMQGYDLVGDTALNNQFAYYASLAGMIGEDYNKALKYIDMAVNDPDNGEKAMEYKAMAYKNLGDSATWLTTLKQGAVLYPESQYFYQELISYYDSHNNMEGLSQFVNDMIARDPDNPFFWYVKGYISQKMFQGIEKYTEAEPLYEEAAKNYQKAIDLDPDNIRALNNLALTYCEQARAFDRDATTDYKSAQYKKDRETVKSFYQKALPHFERLRVLSPDDNSYWLNGLYQCYYVLGKDAELKEIEALMPKD